CDYLVNEGSGDRVELGGNSFYLCSVAEKMSAPFRLRVHGRSGHASMPNIADNALLKAAAYVETLGGHDPEPRLEPEVEGLLRAVAGEVPSDPRELVSFARSLDPLLAEIVTPLVSL